MPIFAVIALVALLGGGTSFAAQGALPGDILYPVKVNVNEEVRAILAFSPQARATVDTERATARLDEAEKLAIKNRLSAGAKAQLEANFSRFAEMVKERLAAMPAEAKADVASQFEAALRAHDRILLNLQLATSTATSSVPTSVLEIKLKVRSMLHDMEDAREEAESEVVGEDGVPEVQAAAEGRIGAAENVIESAEQFVYAKSGSLDAEALADAKAKLQTANDLVAQAKAKVNAKEYGDAFELASKAIRVSQEARVEAQASEDGFELEHRSTSTDDEWEEEDDDDEIRASSSVEIENDGRGDRGNGGVNLNLGL